MSSVEPSRAKDSEGWQPIDTVPPSQDVLVCMTHNLGPDEWETIMWVDCLIGPDDWFVFPRLIEIPFPPTGWMPLPQPPQY